MRSGETRGGNGPAGGGGGAASNLLGKLGLRDRVQAVIWADEHGLVERSWSAGG